MKRTSGAVSRRDLLKTASAAGVFSIVPRNVLGGPGQDAPSETLAVGLIGCGGQGGEDVNTYIKNAGGQYRMLAACDVDKGRLANAKKKWGEQVELYSDWRRLMERKDLDVVSIATPPHWHALLCIAAAQAGKDILCEKPMTRFIAEGREVVKAVQRYGRVFQIGTSGRFGAYNSQAGRTIHKIVRSGLLKPNPGVHIHTGGFPVKRYCGRVNLQPETVPGHLDWDMYCGPAPLRPHNGHRFGWSHRYYWDYEGGSLADFAQHYMDPFQWTWGKDDTSPVEVEAMAAPAHSEACGLWAWVELKYADGLTLVLDGKEWGPRYDRQKPRIIRREDLSAEDQKKLDALPDPPKPMTFVEAVKTRGQSAGHAEAAHRAVTIAHLSNIAIRTGRKIKYDPVKEEIIGDEFANRLVYQPMREPWII
ncbi:MAG: Inositol 2-dehydrogenase [Planctomycetes bacterium ADurb.Bin126]|nr:MAG: Inositol 2-dehydrogenase [Planctomycetes bacterium ADurb.Bin126]HOD80462.1 Gfo/Idh/MocA family oxidoreductase [Phycisphaerae bacterium]HQL72777.1 Gfo/Idh/MocA family oxidoreductase [Phycisphaerae bacterium]